MYALKNAGFMYAVRNAGFMYAVRNGGFEVRTHVCSEVALPMPVLVHQHRFLMVGKPPTLLQDLLYTLFHDTHASPLIVAQTSASRQLLSCGLMCVCTLFRRQS